MYFVLRTAKLYTIDLPEFRLKTSFVLRQTNNRISINKKYFCTTTKTLCIANLIPTLEEATKKNCLKDEFFFVIKKNREKTQAKNRQSNEDLHCGTYIRGFDIAQSRRTRWNIVPRSCRSGRRYYSPRGVSSPITVYKGSNNNNNTKAVHYD